MAQETVTQEPAEKQVEKQVDDAATRAAERLRMERERMAVELEQERKARVELESRMREYEETRKKEELARMQPDERVQAQINALQAQVQGAQAALAAERSVMDQKFRAMELVAYRERALRSVPQEMPQELLSFVSGGSPEEIDQNLNQVVGAYRAILDRAAKPQAPVRPEMAVHAPPPNPAFVPAVTGGSYPVAVNPAPVPEASAPSVDTGMLTAEESIRSGQYGQVRDQLHAMLRKMGTPGNVGTAPRQWTTAPQPQATHPAGAAPPAPPHQAQPNARADALAAYMSRFASTPPAQ
jgi:hypothetical protein